MIHPAQLIAVPHAPRRIVPPRSAFGKQHRQHVTVDDPRLADTGSDDHRLGSPDMQRPFRMYTRRCDSCGCRRLPVASGHAQRQVTGLALHHLEELLLPRQNLEVLPGAWPARHLQPGHPVGQVKSHRRQPPSCATRDNTRPSIHGRACARGRHGQPTAAVKPWPSPVRKDEDAGVAAEIESISEVNSTTLRGIKIGSRIQSKAPATRLAGPARATDTSTRAQYQRSLDGSHHPR